MRTRHEATILLVAASAIILLGAGCTPKETPPTAPPADAPTTGTTAAPLTAAPVPIGDAPSIAIPGQGLVGTWASDCLVPDPKSDYSERHTFTFDPGGTAQKVSHNYEDKGCGASFNATTMSFRYLAPAEGQVDLIDLDSGSTLYDTYAMSAGALKLGQGFRNKFPYPSQVGDSPASRIPTLNNYIVYRRQ